MARSTRVCAVVAGALAAALPGAGAAATATVSLPSLSPVARTLATFASYNVDPSCNRGFHHTDFDNENLAAAASALRPARLRFGGSGADALVYGFSPGAPECAGIPAVPASCDYVTPGCLNATHWAALYGMSQKAGADFIFGVSINLADACAAGAGYAWNATNSGRLLAHLRATGQAVRLFELGNEVNNNGGPPCNLTAAMQAAALNEFHATLAAQLPGAALVGPDTGGAAPLAWLNALLPLVRPGVLSAITHHVYNGVSRGTFNSPEQLDRPLPEIAWYTNVTRALAPHSEVWAGENGPTGGGDDGTCGADAACGLFATTLWYADDMALRAAAGFAQYNRQSLWGGAYGLVNSESGAMALGRHDAVVLRPDFWVSFLWKRTLGRDVLAATSSSRTLRAYAFSGPPPSPHAAADACGAGAGGAAAQLLLLNLLNATVSVALPAPAGAPRFAAWSLVPAPGAGGGAFGTRAALNGATLPPAVDVRAGDPHTFLDGIVQPPVRGTAAGGVQLPPLSTTFLCYGA